MACPRNCNCKKCVLNSQLGCSNVFYTGSNLPASGINTNDNLCVALQKLDAKSGGQTYIIAGACISITGVGSQAVPYVINNDGVCTVDGENGNIILSGTYFKQGGNSFGVAGVLGTLDDNELKFTTNGVLRLNISRVGNIYTANLADNNNDKLQIGGSIYNQPPAKTTAATLFYADDNGVLKTRTASQVLSDIGAVPVGSNDFIQNQDATNQNARFQISYAGIPIKAMGTASGFYTAYLANGLTNGLAAMAFGPNFSTFYGAIGYAGPTATAGIADTMFIHSRGGKVMRFSADSGVTGHMTLNTTGNFLIGTTSDLGGANRLQVNGNIYSNGGIIFNGVGVDSTTKLQIQGVGRAAYLESSKATVDATVTLKHTLDTQACYLNILDYSNVERLEIGYGNPNISNIPLRTKCFLYYTNAFMFTPDGTNFPLIITGTPGNVLIGTTTDAGAKLDVQGGSLRWPNNTTDYTALAGATFYNTSTSRFRGYNGTWRNFMMEGVPIGDYIQNQTAVQQTAAFNISGDSFINGVRVGKGNTSNFSATALGVNALNANTAGGNFNTAVGYEALKSNTGISANTGIGYAALTVLTGGGENVAVGSGAMAAAVSTNYSVAVGNQALGSQQSGNRNTAIGNKALLSSTTAQGNTAVGAYAGTVLNGSQNTIMGDGALQQHTTSVDNTVIGYIGLQSVTSGNRNVIVGSFITQNSSAANITAIDNSVVIGAYAKVNATGETNQIVIGNGAIGLGSNTTMIGNTSTTYAYIKGVLQVQPIASAPTGINGGIYYNSATNKFQGHHGGIWKNFATEDNAFLTGRTIRVENTHPFATDTRTNISKYSQSVPFATITAALSAMASGDNLHICNGTYNESVTFPNILLQIIFIENATINGGANYAVGAINNYDVVIYMRNATITNTGNGGDTLNTAAVFCNVGRIYLFGFANSAANISSTNALAYGDAANQGKRFQNIVFSSTNFNCFDASAFSGSNINVFNNCTLTGGVGFAYGGYAAEMYNCRLIGSTNGIFMGSNIRVGLVITNSFITGTSGNAIAGGTVGAANTRDMIIKDTVLTSANEVLSFGLGNTSLGYQITFANNKVNVTGAALKAIQLDGASTDAATYVHATANDTNLPLFDNTFRTSNVANNNRLKESSTQQTGTVPMTVMSNTLAMYGKQIHTAGATVTMNNGIRILYVNPAATLPALTITLPSAPVDGQEVLIEFGGTVTTGTVVTALTVVGNAGSTLIGASTVTTAIVGGGIHIKYEASTTFWRIIASGTSGGGGSFIQNQNAGFQTATYLITSTGITAQIQTSSATNAAMLVRNTNTSGSARLVATDNGGGERVSFGFGNSAFGTTLLQSKGFIMTNGDEIVLTTDNGATRGLTVDSIGNTRVSKAFISDSIQIHTAGATVTINDNNRGLYVNPAALLSPLTITMPANPRDGQEVLISFGGTLTSGTVVTELSIVGNTGHTVLKGSSITTANAGDGYMLKFESAGNRWRIF